MRGAPVDGCAELSSERIIPAYAGSTPGMALEKNGSEDHPRVCGEHCAMPLRVWSVPGSSPRMRGALSTLGVATERLGIIPAYAGSTLPAMA